MHVAEEAYPNARPVQPRLLIVSDMRVLCEGLALALEREPTVIVVGSVDLSSASRQLAGIHPEVLLLDVTRYEPLEACRRLRQVLPEVKIVAVAVAEIDQEIIACAEAGVSGYVSCSGSVKDVVAAVHRAVRGELLCSPRTAALLFSRIAILSPRPSAAAENILTRREYEVLMLLQEGLSNKEIACCLRIGNATVKNHVHNILAKLQVRRRGEAAAQTRRADNRPLEAQSRS